MYNLLLLSPPYLCLVYVLCSLSLACLSFRYMESPLHIQSQQTLNHKRQFSTRFTRTHLHRIHMDELLWTVHVCYGTSPRHLSYCRPTHTHTHMHRHSHEQCKRANKPFLYSTTCTNMKQKNANAKRPECAPLVKKLPFSTFAVVWVLIRWFSLVAIVCRDRDIGLE